jgi:hypothetical protein
MPRVTGLVVAALLTAVPLSASAARCPRGCRHALKTALGACRAACPKHRPGHDCRSACSVEFKSEKATYRGCDEPTNPTPPNCGMTTITTTATTSTTTSIAILPCGTFLTTRGSPGGGDGQFWEFSSL